MTKVLIVLFPGFGCDKTTWKKNIDPKHPKKGSKINFLTDLKKLQADIYFADIPWNEYINPNTFIDSIHKDITDMGNPSVILTGHSLGVLFCYLYAKKYKSDKLLKIISIDGSYFGPSAVDKIKQIPADNTKLLHYVQFIPVKKLSMPVDTICFRNLKMLSSDTLSYTDESDIKHYTVKYYVNAGHYLHITIADDICKEIANIIKLNL